MKFFSRVTVDAHQNISNVGPGNFHISKQKQFAEGMTGATCLAACAGPFMPVTSATESVSDEPPKSADMPKVAIQLIDTRCAKRSKIFEPVRKFTHNSEALSVVA